MEDNKMACELSYDPVNATGTKNCYGNQKSLRESKIAMVNKNCYGK